MLNEQVPDECEDILNRGFLFLLLIFSSLFFLEEVFNGDSSVSTLELELSNVKEDPSNQVSLDDLLGTLKKEEKVAEIVDESSGESPKEDESTFVMIPVKVLKELQDNEQNQIKVIRRS